VARDKDYKTMLRVLAPLFKHIVVTPFESDRAVAPEELDTFIKAEFPKVKTSVAIDPTHALELAQAATPVDGLILTAGSFYLAGEMRKLAGGQASVAR
ncbi:MAG: bifunctional folylpolyglutamate synthase/dihydrofolate synthase, partial [Planctomycetes bacterium]|nr:bifunctional folylpolyglutamate synthase/dihydrofolate synthase [Planctomycetota bacterium]